MGRREASCCMGCACAVLICLPASTVFVMRGNTCCWMQACWSWKWSHRGSCVLDAVYLMSDFPKGWQKLSVFDSTRRIAITYVHSHDALIGKVWYIIIGRERATYTELRFIWYSKSERIMCSDTRQWNQGPTKKGLSLLYHIPMHDDSCRLEYIKFDIIYLRYHI